MRRAMGVVGVVLAVAAGVVCVADLYAGRLGMALLMAACAVVNAACAVRNLRSE